MTEDCNRVITFPARYHFFTIKPDSFYITEQFYIAIQQSNSGLRLEG